MNAFIHVCMHMSLCVCIGSCMCVYSCACMLHGEFLLENVCILGKEISGLLSSTYNLTHSAPLQPLG